MRNLSRSLGATCTNGYINESRILPDLTMTTSRNAFLNGVRTAVVLLPGVAPFGLITGIATVQSGLSPFAAVAMSTLIFAGASQLAAVSLLAAGAGPFVILLTIAVINLRFAMYSASLAPHFSRLPLLRKLLAGYLLVDQNYALSVVRFGTMEPEAKLPFYMGIGVCLWLVWQAATAAGAFLGANVPPSWSLDFTMPLVFLSMLVVSVRDKAMAVAAIAGGAVATLAGGMPFKLAIVTGATAGIAAGVAAGMLLGRRPGDA
jgi:predicted branched-subunit amino acid permease